MHKIVYSVTLMYIAEDIISSSACSSIVINYICILCGIVQFIGVTSESLALLRFSFYESTLGKLVMPLFVDDKSKREAAESYLEDFLHMMYRPVHEGELQVFLMNVVLFFIICCGSFSKSAFM